MTETTNSYPDSHTRSRSDARAIAGRAAGVARQARGAGRAARDAGAIARRPDRRTRGRARRHPDDADARRDGVGGARGARMQSRFRPGTTGAGDLRSGGGIRPARGTDQSLAAVPRPPSPFAAELGAAEARAQAFAPRRSVDARGIGGQMIAQIRQRHRSEEHTSELQSLMRISYA